MTRIVGISGSVGAGGRTTALVAALLDAAARSEAVETELVDLHAAGLPFCDGRPPAAYEAPVTDLFGRLAEADAFIFASPAYRASISGLLKNFFDLIPVDAVAGKPAALAITGGSREHFLVGDYALRPICSALGVEALAGTLYADHEAMPDIASAAGVEGLDRIASRLVVAAIDSGAQTIDPINKRGESL